MTYRELTYKATRLLEHDQITLGEYEEMTKPLDREIEEAFIRIKLRADIAQLMSKTSFTFVNIEDALKIIDNNVIEYNCNVSRET